MSEASDFNLQISLLERSETDRVLPRRNSGRTAYCRAATLPKQTAYSRGAIREGQRTAEPQLCWPIYAIKTFYYLPSN
ncbi:hypothetical protein ACSAZL_04310 [Methanosarcina sp. T3]|uniref:hypothetical protein n=1 Tax=Methanosarcina sp. T3 TaxID=3439062 RepID=UPI003F849199